MSDIMKARKALASRILEGDAKASPAERFAINDRFDSQNPQSRPPV